MVTASTDNLFCCCKERGGAGPDEGESQRDVIHNSEHARHRRVLLYEAVEGWGSARQLNFVVVRGRQVGGDAGNCVRGPSCESTGAIDGQIKKYGMGSVLVSSPGMDGMARHVASWVSSIGLRLKRVGHGVEVISIHTIQIQS